MSNLKYVAKQPKISPSRLTEETCKNTDSRLVLTFSHVTTNDSYNFNFFRKSLREELKARHELDSLIHNISDCSWKKLIQRQKYNLGGFETLSWYQFKKISIQGKTMTPDSDVYVFRFNGGNYRMCGIKDDSCRHVLHVICYDFDHSLYNHGS